MPSASHPATLNRFLATACALLIGYACLHPLTGWQRTGLPLFDYLYAPWPRYYRTEDIVLNVLGYVPLGFLLVPALPAGLGRPAAALLATVLAAALSFSIETTQNFLPTRVASNVDLGCNVLGALIGATGGALLGRSLFGSGGVLHRLRDECVIPGRAGDIGVILLGLWLLAQLTPETFLFGSGDLRRQLGLPTPMSFDPERFMRLEAVLVAASLVAAGLLGRCLLRGQNPLPVLLLIALAIAAKSLATSAFLAPGGPLIWLTPGTRIGLMAGLLLLAVALLLTRIQQHGLAGLALLLATTLANLIPENPYLTAGLHRLEYGNLLNFHGLTRFIADLWPFLALAWLSALGLWRGEHLDLR
jgi:VanZ family protein